MTDFLLRNNTKIVQTTKHKKVINIANHSNIFFSERGQLRIKNVEIEKKI